jgi:hypothetical protein
MQWGQCAAGVHPIKHNHADLPGSYGVCLVVRKLNLLRYVGKFDNVSGAQLPFSRLTVIDA